MEAAIYHGDLYVHRWFSHTKDEGRYAMCNMVESVMTQLNRAVGLPLDAEIDNRFLDRLMLIKQQNPPLYSIFFKPAHLIARKKTETPSEQAIRDKFLTILTHVKRRVIEI